MLVIKTGGLDRDLEGAVFPPGLYGNKKLSKNFKCFVSIADYVSRLTAVDEPQNDRQKDAEQNTGRNGKVERDILAAPEKVAGQFANPGDFSRQNEKNPDSGDYYPQDDQYFSEIGEVRQRNLLSSPS